MRLSSVCLLLTLSGFVGPIAAQGRPQGAPLGVAAPQPCWRYLGSRRDLPPADQQQVLRELLLVRPVCPLIGYSWGARHRPSFMAYDRDRLEAVHGYAWPGMASQWQWWRKVYLTDLMHPDPWGRPIDGDSLSTHTVGWGILPATVRVTGFIRQHIAWADAQGRWGWPNYPRRPW